MRTDPVLHSKLPCVQGLYSKLNVYLTPAMPCAGLVHYQQNLDCYTATYTISYNSEDPGTQVPRALRPPSSAALSHDANHCTPS